jgi:sugar lactone lactonase YvrE
MGQHINGSIIINSGPDYFLFDPVKKELKKDNFNFPENYLNGDFTTSGSIAHFTSWNKDSKIRIVTKYDLSSNQILEQWLQDRDKSETTVWGWPIEEVLYDSRGILWIGYVSGNSVSAKMKDSDIFINIRTDLSMFEGKELELATFIQTNLKSLHGSIPKTLFEDSQGVIWVGSGNGKLIKIDIGKRESEMFVHDPSDSTSIPSGMIISISEDSRDNLWIGTWPTGMVRFNKKDGKSKRYYEQDGGLIDNTVNAIIPDDDGYLWISTKNGICKFNPVTEKFLDYYYAEDGLQSNEFLFDAALKATNGTIYFGGSNGVSYVEPEKIFKNPNLPMIDISSIYKNGEKVILGLDAGVTRQLEVTYKDRGISFDFNGLNYTRTEKNRYKYRMVGYDPNWIDAGDRRFTSYTNLPPGNYVFQVTGSNNDGLWSEQPAEIQVNVYPPPWATWWAYIIYLLSLIGSAYTYLQYVKARDMRENEELRKTEELELARQFQLDLLPSYIPKLPEYEIAAKIDTATEVGGAYYDFFEQDDGSIYLVTGDATGHGMTAGMMVSITKAGLHGISQPDTKDIMNQLNTVIKNIDLGQNRMALNIGHLKNGSVEFSSAGMPPLYMYNSKEKKLTEVLQVGLPLGSLKSEDYTSDVYEFNSGDVMIFLSDGLPEATNANDEMLGYEAVYDCMLENIHQEPQDLLDTLSKLGSDWIKGTLLDDDITLLVVKKK